MRRDAFRLSKHDYRGSTEFRSNVETTNEIYAAVSGPLRNPPTGTALTQHSFRNESGKTLKGVFICFEIFEHFVQELLLGDRIIVLFCKATHMMASYPSATSLQ